MTHSSAVSLWESASYIHQKVWLPVCRAAAKEANKPAFTSQARAVPMLLGALYNITPHLCRLPSQ